MRPAEAFRAISDELLLDGNARQNLATFCQTWEEPQVHKLMDLCIDKNLIDKDEYPQTAEIERRCVSILADLWNAPATGEPVGCSAIGSSEACMLGGMAAKWRWRAKRRAAGKPTDNPNMVCGPVQVVWHKFAKYWDIEMREIPMSPGRYCMDVGADARAGGREHHHGGADLRRHLHRFLRARARALPGTRQAAGGHRPRRRHPRGRGQRRLLGPVHCARTSCGTSGSPGSSPSAPRDTSSGWRRSAWAGSCGGTPPSCPTTSSST